MSNRKQTSGYFRDEFGKLARYYDMGLRVGFLMVGGERAFRRAIIDAAKIEPGHSVLDVNCGTGTLALMMAPLAGEGGQIVGTDLAGRMLDVGRRKDRQKLVDFILANAEDLPFPDASFDRVTSSLAIHEMNRVGRANALDEIWRVLRPKGRLTVADLRRPDTRWTRFGMRLVRLGETDTLPDMWEHDLGREISHPGFEIRERRAVGRGFFEIIGADKR